MSNFAKIVIIILLVLSFFFIREKYGQQISNFISDTHIPDKIELPKFEFFKFKKDKNRF